MNSVSDDADSKFEKWLNANELHARHDFNFAFTSAQKAFEACPKSPQAAADARDNISHDDVEVASSWTLWTKSRRSTRGQKDIHRLGTRPALKLWRGLHAKKSRADQGPANDTARMRSAAKDALHVAFSWKGRGRLASE